MITVSIEIKDARLEDLGSTTVPYETPEGVEEVPGREYMLTVVADVTVEKGFLPLISSGKLYVKLADNIEKAMYDRGIYDTEHFKEHAVEYDIEAPTTKEVTLTTTFAVEEGAPKPRYYVGAYAEIGYTGYSDLVWEEVMV